MNMDETSTPMDVVDVETVQQQEETPLMNFLKTKGLEDKKDDILACRVKSGLVDASSERRAGYLEGMLAPAKR